MKLIQVQTFFRHGARSPLHHVRSPNVEDAFWTSAMSESLAKTQYPFRIVDTCTGSEFSAENAGTLPIHLKLPGGLYTGELVQQGQQDTYNLGCRLRRVYMDEKAFLSADLDHNEVYCRSTYIRRTIESLKCLIAGLFTFDCHGKKEVEPLVIYTEPLEREYLFPNAQNNRFVERFYREGVAEHVKSTRHLDLKRKLKHILGVKKLYDDFRPTPWDCPVYVVRDDYVSRRAAGFPLPPGLDELFPTMHELAAEELYWEHLGKQSQWDNNIELVMNDVFKMILCNIRNFHKIPKFHLYSCHDSTLMLLLYALGCFDGSWPPFAADLSFEIYIDEKHLADLEADPKLHDTLLHVLWLRVVYLGKPVPLECLWRIPSSQLLPGYVPIDCLLERWPRATPNTPYIPKVIT